MKNLLVVIFSLVLLSCGDTKENKSRDTDCNYKVIEVDSCEYLIYKEGSNSGWGVHKGNCKYCKLRNENKK